MVKIGIVGFGRWGPKLGEQFLKLGVLSAICDSSLKGLINTATADYWRVDKLTEYSSLTNDIDAVAIATPYQTHYQIAKYFMEHGKHVLVEKPMCETAKQCEELIKIAEENRLILMVGHTYMYNQAIRDMLNMIEKKPADYACNWQNQDPPRAIKDTIWNVAPHAISIFLKINPEIKKVRYLKEDGPFCSIYLDNNEIDIGYDSLPKFRHIVVDFDIEYSVEFHEEFNPVFKRDLGYWKDKPFIWQKDYTSDNPLFNECQHFLACVETGNKPFTPGEDGLKVVEIMERINL